MKTSCSKFWLGLGLGSIIGVISYRFSGSSKGKILKEKVFRILHQIGGKSEEIIGSTKEKVADKISNDTFNTSEKLEEIKNKMHNISDNAKK